MFSTEDGAVRREPESCDYIQIKGLIRSTVHVITTNAPWDCAIYITIQLTQDSADARSTSIIKVPPAEFIGMLLT